MTTPKRRLGEIPKKPRVLLYDVETAPALVYTWSNYQTNVIATAEDWYLLSFAYKWLDEDEVHWVRKGKKKRDDKALTKTLWELFNEADVIVAHNGDRFDARKATARFVTHGLGPPSPFRTIDTKKVFARHTMNYSNALDEIGRREGLGRKLPHQGIQLWLDCMNEDPDAWAVMEAYNRHDVELLEQVFHMIRPWVDSVNFSVWDGSCRRCGGFNLVKDGKYTTLASVFQAYRCKDCGGWSRDPQRLRAGTTR